MLSTKSACWMVVDMACGEGWATNRQCSDGAAQATTPVRPRSRPGRDFNPHQKKRPGGGTGPKVP